MNKRFFLAIAVSVIFLWLAVRQANWNEFFHTLSRANPGLIILSFGITLAVCMLRALRWRLLLSPTKRLTISRVLSIIMIGFLANNLLPARLGEVVMAFLLHAKEAIGKSRSIATIFLDRFMDVFALLSLLIIAIIIAPFPSWVDRLAGIGIVLLAAAAVLVWLMLTHRQRCLRLLQVLLRPLPKRVRERLLQTFVMFLEGLKGVQQLRLMLQAVVISLLIWLSLAGGVYLLFCAFGFSLGFAAAITVLAIVNLGLIIPSSPGFIGTFQFFCVAALGLFMIDQNRALSFSVAYHLSQWLPTTLAGYYYLNQENLNLIRLMKIERTQQ